MVFSTVALQTFGAGPYFHCGRQSCARQMLAASPIDANGIPSSDNQKCLETLSVVPWEAKLPPDETSAFNDSEPKKIYE